MLDYACAAVEDIKDPIAKCAKYQQKVELIRKALEGEF
jgi:hypothetical protein